MYVATNMTGYSPGQITRMTQRKIYDLRTLGLSPEEISQRLRDRLGSDGPSRVFGGCCEGSEF